MLLLPLSLIGGVAAGIVLGGKLSRLAEVRVQAPALAFTAAGLQAVLIAVPASARFPMVALTYAMAGGWLALNLNGRTPMLRLGGALLAVGWLLNTAVILANGGMPVSRSAVAGAGGDASAAAVEESGIRKHLAGTEGRRLTPLADVIALPSVGVVSAGDLVLAAGLGTAVVAGMAPPARRRRTPLLSGAVA